MLEIVVIPGLLGLGRAPARRTRGLLVALVAGSALLIAPTAWGVQGALSHDHASHADDHGDEAGHADGDHHDDAGGDDHHDDDMADMDAEMDSDLDPADSTASEDADATTYDTGSADGDSKQTKKKRVGASDGHADDGHGH